ncbi:hypothetical protein HY78_08575 [Rhizorhabdus wittichii DC-6]|nr:hypothetical protein HY78_08575 [Rhizorhabdus wittichii DC-6]
MSAQPYHKRYHSDALAGFMSLSLEERGAYQTLLDMIYDRGGPIPGNDRLIAGYMGCSLRKWSTLREMLVAKGKIRVLDDGSITNDRAEKELENYAKTSRKLSENGLKGARKKHEVEKKSNDFNDGELALPEPGHGHIRSQKPDSVTNVTGGDEPPEVDLDKAFWDTAKGYLRSHAKGDPGALVGRWSRDFGQTATAEAISRAQVERAVEPIAFIEASLRKGRARAETALDHRDALFEQANRYAGGGRR